MILFANNSFWGMITEISIANYKSILYQKFSLARVNVFVGRNSSGKTNILEAVGMAAAAHDNALDNDSLQSRGIRVVEPLLTFHSSNRQDRSKEIEIEWRERQSTKKAKLICDNPDDISASWKDISWLEPAYVEKLNELIRYIGDGMNDEQYPFSDETKNAVLNTAFRGSRAFREYLIYHALTEQQIQELFESESRLPAFFAINNIVTTLTSDLCGNVMKTITQLAAKHNRQLLIATNRPAIVRGMNLADPEQKLFLVKQIEDGQTIVKDLTDMSLFDL